MEGAGSTGGETCEKEEDVASQRPWTRPMPGPQFEFLRQVLGAPSPIGYEGAMTHGVLEPYLRKHLPASWGMHRFRGNAGLVADSHPGGGFQGLTVMAIGHADKIRLQVRSIGDDGKIWVNSDSFLPMTLLGHEVILFSEDPSQPGAYRRIDGGTIEALGAIHFADSDVRAGKKGITPEQLFLELQLHGNDRKKQVEALGIKAGDPILLARQVRAGFAADTFYGAYLDNGLGCFVVAEAARLLGKGTPLERVRFLGAIATHEEIGRMGSRVQALQFAPDIVVGVDVSHDLDAAPGVKDRRYPPNTMGKGFTLAVGSVVSAHLNSIIQQVANEHTIPCQLNVVGRDTGTDAMAGALASIDAAATSIGFPIRNMHTSSEVGHTGDVLAAVHVLVELVRHLEETGLTAAALREGHPRLDQAGPLTGR